MTNPKHNGKGNTGVATQQTNGAAVKANVPAPKELTEAEKAELERKAQIEEHRRYFDGLLKLTTMRERYTEHKTVLENLTVSDEELQEFEVKTYHGLGITIKDGNHQEYQIRHPKLVAVVCEFLTTHFNEKIAECEDKILNYGK